MTRGEKTAGGTGRTWRPKGFRRAAALAEGDIRRAAESRGFAVSRLLTHWAEIAGAEIAEKARPVEITYGRGFGATLTLLTTGAHAPVLEMQKDRLIEKVNAAYGYRAVSRIRLTQTASTGFAEGQAVFAPAQTSAPPETREVTPEAKRIAAGVGDDGLRAALERLGTNIQTKTRT